MNASLLERLQYGLWRDNPGLVQLLGLCPLLAVTTSFVNGLGLGLATLAVLTLSNLLVSATRRWIRQEIRIPIYVLIIASLVTCVELIFKAWFPLLDRSLGIFIPLIVTNCAIVARAEVFASRNTVADSVADGVIPKNECEDLVIVCGVFIHWDAADDAKIREYNYEATKLAIARAMKGEPSADEMVANKDTAQHPFAGE